MKKPSIIIYPDDIHSSCSFWRAMGVFPELSRQGIIDMARGTWDESWATLRNFDIAVFQRPMSKQCEGQIAMCHDLGLKIWIDIDDYNHIPEHHPVYDVYKREYDEKYFERAMIYADVVTTTTPYLLDYYLTYSPKVELIPNAINDHWLKPRRLKKDLRVLFRGGNHHHEDMYHYKDQVIKVMKAHPEWKFIVCGSDPIFLRNEIKNYEYAGNFNMHDYFAYILQTNNSVFLVPLIDNDFNRGKSNISFLEATYAGAVAIIPEFLQGENVWKYGKEQSIGDALDQVLSAPDNVKIDCHKKALKEVAENYSLSKVNQKRIDIINKLINN